jgi:hypothetical protein
VIPKGWFEKWVTNNQKEGCGTMAGLFSMAAGAPESGLERSAGERHVLIVDLGPH